MASEKIVWQPTWQNDTPARELVEKSSHKGKIYEMLEAFLQQAGGREFVQVAVCVPEYTVYIDVVHLDWAHYPCRFRASLAWDVHTGEVVDTYAFAHVEWAEFMDNLLGYPVARHKDCGHPERTKDHGR